MLAILGGEGVGGVSGRDWPWSVLDLIFFGFFSFGLMRAVGLLGSRRSPLDSTRMMRNRPASSKGFSTSSMMRSSSKHGDSTFTVN